MIKALWPCIRSWSTEKGQTNLPLQISNKRQIQRFLSSELDDGGNSWVSPASDVPNAWLGFEPPQLQTGVCAQTLSRGILSHIIASFFTTHQLGAVCRHGHHHYYQFLNRVGRWGTTDDFATSFLHFSLFFTALWDLPNFRPVHSLMLSTNLFLCLPCRLAHFTVPCKMILARPDERETWSYHCSLRLFTIVRRSSCGPIARWVLARTSSLVTWSLYEMCSILR